MRLLTTDSNGDFLLQEFHGRGVPPYGILSHRWLPNDEEPTFQDLNNGMAKYKPGYWKLLFCHKQAKLDNLQYFWSDTVCIDKTNSAELSENINSMFRFYRQAEKCYVYLWDVSWDGTNHALTALVEHATPWLAEFKDSRWFTRGWTLQELVAPRFVKFFSKEGHRLGDKLSLMHHVHEITGIPLPVLQGESFATYSIDDRLSWAAQRQTTKEEDMAYALIGLLDVSLPLIYGEGREKAFGRLRLAANPSLPPPSAEDARSPSRRCPFSTVPDFFRRDIGFIPRGGVLDDIDSKLQASSQRVALVGLGGLGKSQLAIEYGHRLHEKCPREWIFWINAGTTAQFREAFQAIAERLNLATGSEGLRDVPLSGAHSRFSTESRETDSTLKAVHRWLMNPENGHWTLIIDNADDQSVFFASEKGSSKQTGASQYLPRSSHGRILLTSRNEGFAARLVDCQDDIIRIGSMTEDESSSLFRSKRGVGSQDSEEGISKLVRVLYYIPLAISQAAAYLNRSKNKSVEQYLQIYL